MKNPFARRETATELPPVPDDVTETWRGSTSEVVLRASLDEAADEDRETAEALSDLVLGVVRGVQEGAYGDSMPADASNASVRLEVTLCEDDFGPNTRHEAEDLTGRLKGVAPLAVVTYPRGGAAPVWDDASSVLRVSLHAVVGSDDESTRGKVRALVQATLRAVTAEKVKALVPEAAGTSYPVRIMLTLAKGRDGAEAGPLTEKALAAMTDQLAGSRVTFERTA